MRIRIKTKLSLGFSFLFGVILLIGGLGAFYIYRIGDESKEILKDNYESIIFSKSMMESLDGLETHIPEATSTFENNLQAQEKNITEPGENDLTQGIRKDFEVLKGHFSAPLASHVREKLYRIIDLNLSAIERKNNLAKQTINQVLFYIATLGVLCFIVVFTFIVNFPGYIANPIRELTSGIQQIANKNYGERLHFKSNDEFAELAEAFNTMAKKLNEYEHSNIADLMFEKKRIETIINNMQDAIIGLNEKKTVLFVNPQALAILSIPEAEIVGKYAPDLALHNDLLRTLLLSGEPIKPLKIILNNKESFFSKEVLQVAGKSETDGGSIKLGEVIILKNITKFQELDQAKTNFIATISHELKTPIASIKLSSSLLEDSRIGSLNKEQKELIGSIQGDTERLLRITGELLNLSQVETGKIELRFQPVKAIEVIRYATESLRVQAQYKNLAISITASESLPTIHADLEKTTWVLINLLSNAIRYSPENGTIEISVKEKGKHLEFTVQDSGKGIDPKYTDRVFDRFFRIPGSEQAGTGLGLAIAREFIRAQGGEIEVCNSKTSGACFMFRLPCQN